MACFRQTFNHRIELTIFLTNIFVPHHQTPTYINIHSFSLTYPLLLNNKPPTCIFS